MLSGMSWAAALPKMYMLASLTVCPPAQQVPQVFTHFNAAHTQYSEQEASASLKKRMANNPDSTLATDRRSTVFGVTSSQTKSRVEVNFSALTDRNSLQQCLYINEVHFYINYEPSVYVSSEILDMPCSYHVTREHEQQHVAIDYQVMQSFLPDIKRSMQAYVYKFSSRGFGPYPAERLDSYKQQIFEQIMAAGEPLVEKMRVARRAQQGSIDTPENYKREAAKCPQDRQRIYQKFGGGR